MQSSGKVQQVGVSMTYVGSVWVGFKGVEVRIRRHDKVAEVIHSFGPTGSDIWGHFVPP